MIGCLRTRKQSLIALYFESETVLKFYKLDAWPKTFIGGSVPDACLSLGWAEVNITFEDLQILMLTDENA